MKRLNQSGSHVIALALLILVLGLVGFTGYKVQQSHDNKTKVSQATAPTKAVVSSTIANAADLQTVSQSLDQSSAQLNSGLDDSQLNADLNSML